VFSYAHGEAPGAGLTPSGCRNGTSEAVSGIAFYQGTRYPSQYQHALFFADYAVGCIYAMRAGASGVPDPTRIDVIERAADLPVALEVGPGGDIFYASISGAIRRITFGELTAKATADRTTGDDPLTVHFDGSASADPAGGPLGYAWDLDGDGAFNDSTDVRPVRTYARGAYRVRLQITDRNHRTAVSPPLVITAGERPLPTIVTPGPGAPWKARQRISFAGTATDPQDGVLPAAALTWRILLLHCPMGGCHQHPTETFQGVASGSFVTSPDGYPAYYDIELTATDSDGFTGKTTVRIDAIGTELTLQSQPSGLPLLYTGTPVLTPDTVVEVAGDAVTVEALPAQDLGGASYVFTGWSDGAERAHVITVPDKPTTYTAIYEIDTDRDGLPDSRDPCPGDPAPACAAPSGPGCAAGPATPGPGSVAAFGLVLVLGLRLRRRVCSQTPRVEHEV
jgi:MYXO-CTERM domain-containing protein